MPHKDSLGQFSIFDIAPATDTAQASEAPPEADDQLHEGYSSGHPWYYKLGGRVLSVEEIKRAKFKNYDPIHRTKSGKPRPAIEVQLQEAKEGLQRDIGRYNQLLAEGDKACSKYDLMMGYDAKFNLSLVHNHVAYFKGLIHKLEEASSRFGF